MSSTQFTSETARAAALKGVEKRRQAAARQAASPGVDQAAEGEEIQALRRILAGKGSSDQAVVAAARALLEARASATAPSLHSQAQVQSLSDAQLHAALASLEDEGGAVHDPHVHDPHETLEGMGIASSDGGDDVR